VLNISEDTIVIGAPREASAGTGVESDGSTDTSAGSGAAYVFVREDGDWTQQALLKASTNGAGDAFGFAVAVDQSTIVVGAAGEDSAATGDDDAEASNALPDSGAAYVFVREDGAWTHHRDLHQTRGDHARRRTVIRCRRHGAAVLLVGRSTRRPQLNSWSVRQSTTTRQTSAPGASAGLVVNWPNGPVSHHARSRCHGWKAVHSWHARYCRDHCRAPRDRQVSRRNSRELSIP
jgi:hypothetical protein